MNTNGSGGHVPTVVVGVDGSAVGLTRFDGHVC
jgi:hypothetical protein